ncbi:MAG: hypothetical protein HY751_10895 [Nitrospinae bacterium]|nr:hypothetical protein [Nitrospinota bacterium]
MSNLKLWALMALAGAIIGTGAGLFGKSDVPVAGLESQTRAEQLKELEKLRIEGIRLASDKKYGDAIAVFLRLNYVNPHDQFPYQQMAEVFKGAGEKEFTSLMQTQIAGRPNAKDLDRALGGVYHIAGREDLAEAALEEYLTKNPGDVSASYFLGAVKNRLGDRKGAIGILSGVIEKEPTHYYAYVELQGAYEAEGDAIMSAKMLGMALKYNPANNKEGVCCGLLPDPSAVKKKEEGRSQS